MLRLCSSVDLVTVVGSHLRPGDPFDASDVTADNAAAAASEVLRLARRTDVAVVAGSNVGLADRHTPIDSAGARAIIDAAHADSTLPLFVCLGAGLTELASAWLLDPTIAGKLTAVWIGGAEHPASGSWGVETPPGAPAAEYNSAIDPIAAQVVLNDSDLVVWQVPRDAYRQTLATMDEADAVADGPLGRHLVDSLDRLHRMAGGFGLGLGEGYIFGDSPLVLLTALSSSFEPWPTSSRSRVLPAPVVADDGSYTGEVMAERTLRVWTHLDLRLMFADLFAKLRAADRPSPS